MLLESLAPSMHGIGPPSLLPSPLVACAEELQVLLDKLAFRKGVDLLLSVGDLVNKGPDSEQASCVPLPAVRRRGTRWPGERGRSAGAALRLARVARDACSQDIDAPQTNADDCIPDKLPVCLSAVCACRC